VRTRVTTALLLALTLLSGRALAAPPPAALPPGTLRVADVRAGMKGYGLTVFAGTKVERFDVRVVSVVPGFMPGMDIILVYCDDERVKYAGITGGMSGSPIFLEGKLAGALAYGWQFGKDPIAGVTPIEYMIETARMQLRGPDASPAFASAERETNTRALAQLERAGAMPADAWWTRFVMPPRRTSELASATGGGLRRVAVPLSVAGFEGRVAEELGRALAPYGLEVMAGGGAGGRAKLPVSGVRLEPGGPIGVQLVRGDMSAASTGTVTWIDGRTVAAFGHPMFGSGETYLPVTTAYVHTFINSIARSFKLATPIEEIGTLTQDRAACIVADTGRRADVIPVDVTVKTPSGTQTFNAEVARHRFLTPMLVSMVVSNALRHLTPDMTDVVAEVRSTIGVRGFPPIEMTDNFYSQEGMGPRVVSTIGALRAVSMLLFNPFQRIRLDRIGVKVDLTYAAEHAQITGVRLGSDEVEPGSRVSLQVNLQPFGGREYVESIPLDIPARLAGQTLKIDVAAGQMVRPDLAPPVDLRGFIDAMRPSFSSRTLVVTISTPDEGATIRGRIVPDLPTSELDTLRPANATARAGQFKSGRRIVHGARSVVVGQSSLQVRVKDDVR